MQKDPAEIGHLIYGYLENELSDDQQQVLNAWLADSKDHQVLFDRLTNPDTLHKAVTNQFRLAQHSNRLLQQIFTTIDQQEDGMQPLIPVHRVHFLRTAWFRWAAIVLLIAGTASILYLNNRAQYGLADKRSAIIATDLPPGGNKAILTLSDGSTIVLDTIALGTIAEQGKTSVMKLANGQITYDVKDGTENGGLMNTMATPKGGQYRLTLPDGTKVWLNAATSITYPVAFTGKTRNVVVTGEAYFEVTSSKSQPFTVSVAGGSSVEVLGTRFNINSYADDGNIKTTLLEGSVRVNSVDNMGLMLRPGQQAEATAAGQVVKVNDHVDVEGIMAWKEGFFNLQNIGLHQFMKQVERWYDVEVIYENQTAQVRLGGKIKRDLTLKLLLEGLAEMGVKTKMQDRKIVVMH